jgi:hypothetical protein
VGLKRSGFLVAGVGIAWLAAAIILFTGCTATEAGNAAAAPGSDGGGTSPSVVMQAGEELQSNKEKEMVKLFRLLLELEEKPELAIGKQQAEAMLPIIREIVTEGTLLSADEQAIVALLRDEQKALYQDKQKWRERADQREYEAGKETEKDKEMETEEMKKEGADKESLTEDPYIIREENVPKPPDNMKPMDRDQPGPEDWAAGEKSLEQKLIELLESKAYG